MNECKDMYTLYMSAQLTQGKFTLNVLFTSSKGGNIHFFCTSEDRVLSKKVDVTLAYFIFVRKILRKF
jgi:hypothetical protein